MQVPAGSNQSCLRRPLTSPSSRHLLLATELLHRSIQQAKVGGGGGGMQNGGARKASCQQDIL